MFSIIFVGLVLSLPVLYCEASAGRFSYDDQGNWTGVCVTGHNTEQSPIDIITSDVRENSSLTGLQFNSAWFTQSSGTFKNFGSTVKFIPSTVGAATFENFLGTYELQQFHMHWGPRTGTGSEHRINGRQAELEIHFVHFKRGADSSQRDYAAVVGVLADVEEGDVSGIWAKLDIPAIQSNTSSPLSITGLVLSNLLPIDRSYYYYMGSLTTPPCSEIVQWFVLKNTIKVPSEFLNQLRMVEDPDGHDLEVNYRDAQPIGSRVVMEGSQSFNKPAMIVLLISLLLVKLI